MLRFATVVGLMLTLALLAADSALACSCAYIAPEKQLRRSDGAAIARLLKVRPVGSERGGESSFGPWADYVYRTGRVYKGRPHLQRGRRLVVRSPRSSAICGLSDQVGRLTGLFLVREEGRFTSGSCGEVTAAQMRTLDASAAAGGPTCS